MVITKVFQIKTIKNLKYAVSYIDDKNKTENYVKENFNTELKSKVDYIIDESKVNLTNGNNDFEFMVDRQGNIEMVSTYGLLNIQTSYDEMMLTKLQAKELLGEKRGIKTDVLAHHIIQSFSPEDNLTPEEIHEIGRRTVLELTGGNHEFIIATHLDKQHLHNHIIFNTTNSVTLKKFRWTKGTKKSLENISDKHADIFGAKIIDKEKIISHKKYEAYKQQNTFRYELKERLKFLIKNSNSREDFLEKAKILNVEIKEGGKELKFKLLDSKQERYIRDRTLSKNGYYSKENIIQKVELNKTKITTEKIKEAYQDYKQQKEEDFEIRLTIEDWQIEKETKRGIYLKVDFGIKNSGTILVPHNKIDELENGYEVFIKRNDYFYFTNEKNATNNKFIRATTLAKQLSRENGKNVIYKNYYVGKIDKLIEEFNYLSKNNVTEYSTFKEFKEKFNEKLDQVDIELEKLDSKLAELNKLHSALLGANSNNINDKKVAKEILSKLKMPVTTNKKEVEKLLQDIRIERDILNMKYNEIIGEYKYTKNIEKNTSRRKNSSKIRTKSDIEEQKQQETNKKRF